MAAAAAAGRAAAAAAAGGAARRPRAARRNAARMGYGGPPGGPQYGGGMGGGTGGGPSFGSAGEQRTPGGLILPGQRPDPTADPRDAQFGGGGMAGGGMTNMEAKAAQTAASFRPPPSFVEEVNDGCENDQERLQRLTMRMGTWSELAKLLPTLRRGGVDAKTVEIATGLTCAEQNEMEGALAVRSSMEAAGADEMLLRQFDNEDGFQVLYRMVRIPANLRLPSAEWVLAVGGGNETVKELSDAITKFERYKGRAKGFEELPGDCMAFNLWRTVDTAVVKKTEALETLGRAMELCQSERALDTIQATLDQYGDVQAEDDTSKDTTADMVARLPSSRMREDEAAGVLVPVAGSLADQGIAALVRACAAASPSPAAKPFGVIEAPASKYIFVPGGWAISKRITNPVAIFVPNRTTLPEQTKASAEPAMLVIDAADARGEPGAYYAMDTGSGIQLIAGGSEQAMSAAAGGYLLGAGVMVLLVPQRGSDSAFDSPPDGDEVVAQALGGSGF